MFEEGISIGRSRLDLDYSLFQTYFYQEDNLLSGLSLSRDNLTVRVEYENTLRFYGYDLQPLNVIFHEEAPKPLTTTAETTILADEVTTLEPPTTEIATEMVEFKTETEPPQAETEAATMKIEEITTSTQEPTKNTDASPENKPAPSTTTKPTTILKPIPETTEPAPPARTTMLIFMFKPPMAGLTDAPSEATTDNTSAQTETATQPTTIDITDSTIIPSTEPPPLIRNRRESRHRRSNSTSQVFETFLVSYRPPDYNVQLHYDSNDPLNYFDYEKLNPTVSQRFKASSDFLPAQHRQDQQQLNEDTEEADVQDLFYLNSFETIQVPYKMYNTILRYAYVDTLRSSVVEFPLDSDNYNLLILLPDFDHSLEQLLITMRNEYAPTLRQIKRRLKPQWIKTIVPKFHQKGNVVLTSDLMKVSVSRW